MSDEMFYDEFGVSQLNIKEFKLELKERDLSLTGLKTYLAEHLKKHFEKSCKLPIIYLCDELHDEAEGCVDYNCNTIKSDRMDEYDKMDL